MEGCCGFIERTQSYAFDEYMKENENLKGSDDGPA